MGAVITTIEKGRQKRKEILEAIISYIQEHGYAPTVREIGETVGLKSPSSVQSHLDRMLVDGIIETDAEVGSPRAIRVPGYEFRKMRQEAEDGD